MPSTASNIARARHKAELESNAQEDQFRDAENAVRRSVDQDRADEKRRATAEANSPPPSGGRVLTHVRDDDEHQRARVDAVGKVMSDHARQRGERTQRHRKELDAAAKMPDQPGGHRAPDTPQPGDPVHDLWPSMNSAERQDWHRIVMGHAKKRDDTDANYSGQVERAHRYSQSARQGTDRAADAHLVINRAEHGELRGLRAKVENRMAQDHHRVERQAAERRDMDARHRSEQRGVA